MPLALRLLQRSTEPFDADANLAIVEGGKTQQQPANVRAPQGEPVNPQRPDIVSACGLFSPPRSHSVAKVRDCVQPSLNWRNFQQTRQVPSPPFLHSRKPAAV